MSLLVADIGGTHARFGLADDDGSLVRTVVLSTGQMLSARQLLADALEALESPSPEVICLAVAGPVQDGRARITNHGEVFDSAALSEAFGIPVHLVNDFVALAHAVPYFSRLEQIGGVVHEGNDRVKALIGPGSGCGMAMLIPAGGVYRVFPSEGGHADLAITNALEAEIWTALSTRVSHVCWEAVLSGPGLVNLHAALCDVWGVAAGTMTAAQISAAAIDAADPVCHQALDLFFGFLGTAAGNLAVTTMATGGVYIGGGIVPRLTAFARRSPLRRRFEERGMLSAVVSSIPLYLVLDDMPGLAGAAQYARRLPR